MGREAGCDHEKGCFQAGLLRKLIEISRRQIALAAEDRVDDLIASRAEREELFGKLDLSCESCRPELERQARELAESDRVLAEAVRAMMDSIGLRLGQVKTGVSALKAYARF